MFFIVFILSIAVESHCIIYLPGRAVSSMYFIDSLLV